MRDGDRGSSPHQHRERALNIRLDLAVDRTRRLVEHEQRRIGGDRPREREQLPLADADRGAALAQHLRVAVRQPPNHAVGADARRRRAPPLLRRSDSTDRMLVNTSPAKRKMSCCTYPISARSSASGDVAHVDAVDEDPPALRIVEPQQQIDDRRLAGARVPDQRQRFARLDFKAHALEHPLRRRGRASLACNMAEIVCEPDVLELDRDAVAPPSRWA